MCERATSPTILGFAGSPDVFVTTIFVSGSHGFLAHLYPLAMQSDDATNCERVRDYLAPPAAAHFRSSFSSWTL